MAAITISREFGSDGMDIAKKIADELGFLLVDKQVIGEILGQYGLVDFKKVYESVPAFWDGFDTQKMEQRQIIIDMMNRTIVALANHGDAVIVGRGGYLVLNGYADVLNVGIQCSLTSRTSRVMKARNLGDHAKAETVARENEEAREHFISSVYGFHWNRAKNFDLVINTDKVLPEKAVKLIVETAKNLDVMQIPGSTTVKSVKVDPVLAAVVAKVFENR